MFTNTQQLFLKGCLDLAQFAEVEQEWGVLLHGLWTLWKLHERAMLSCGLWSLQKSQEDGACFCVFFGGCRGHGWAFSKGASRNKISCNPEQPQISHRSLLTERENKQRVADPGDTRPWEQSHHSQGSLPWVMAWGSLFSGSDGIRPEIKGPASTQALALSRTNVQDGLNEEK